MTTLKNSPGVSPGGGCWYLELTDALWLVVESQVNNTLYWAKEFFYSASFSVEELNEIGETEFESRRFLNVLFKKLSTNQNQGIA